MKKSQFISYARVFLCEWPLERIRYLKLTKKTFNLAYVKTDKIEWGYKYFFYKLATQNTCRFCAIGLWIW